MLELRDRIDKALAEFLADAVDALVAAAPELAEFGAAAQSFVNDGGKRLRPSFCYWGHLAAGGDDHEPLMRAAASLELLQACALIHDDVIDASDTRRGAPSVHRRFAGLHRSAGWHGDPEAFGSAAAILLGDLALVWADGMLASSGMPADALGRAAMVWQLMRVEVMAGQYLDVVEQARGGGSVERALRVARFKSAKYTVERPLHLGATLAGAEPPLLAALSNYGLPLGEAFQLRDDLLGVYGDPSETGKPAGDDLREGKRTVLIATALAAANDAQRERLRRLLGDPALDADGVTILRAVIAATGAVEQVEQLIAERERAALAALDDPVLPRPVAAALAELATTLTRRDR